MDLGKSASIGTKNLLGRLIKNFSWLFFIGLLALLVMEGLEMNKSVSTLLSSQQEPEITRHDTGVKIDFKSYETATKRIKFGQDYSPEFNITSNPFGSR